MGPKNERLREGIVQKRLLPEKFLDFVAWQNIPEVSIDGIDHLDEVRSLLQQGKKVRGVANHRSNLDEPTIKRGFEQAGYKDIVDKLVYLLGTGIIDNPLSGRVRYAVRHIEVWPKSRVPKDKKEKKRAMEMTRRSKIGVESVEKNGDVLFLFPEGTRTRTGFFGPAVPETAHFLRVQDAYLFPMALVLTDERYPVGAFWPNRGPVAIRVGKPVQLAELHEGLEGLGRKQQDAVVIERVMGKIAELQPVRYIRNGQ